MWRHHGRSTFPHAPVIRETSALGAAAVPLLSGSLVPAVPLHHHLPAAAEMLLKQTGNYYNYRFEMYVRPNVNYNSCFLMYD